MAPVDTNPFAPKLLPMSPELTVTHVSGMDPSSAARAAANAYKDAGVPVKHPQRCGYPEWLLPFNLHACISVAGSWAPAASPCGVAAGHQRTNGGFLATKPMGIGPAERAQAKARP